MIAPPRWSSISGFSYFMHTEHAAQVDGEDSVPLFLGDSDRRSGLLFGPGVVDVEVEEPEAVKQCVLVGFQVLVARHVARVRCKYLPL